MSRSGSQRELSRNQRLEAAINKEEATRRRVASLENRVSLHDDSLKALHDHVNLTFWARLRWLLRGK